MCDGREGGGGLWEEGPIGQGTVQFIIKTQARKWLFLCNVIEKEKGEDIAVISSLSHADIAPINHISYGIFCVH